MYRFHWSAKQDAFGLTSVIAVHVTPASQLEELPIS